MAKTTNLELPLDTHGTVALKQTVEAGFKKLDGLLGDLNLAYTHAETEAETVKDALDDIFTRLAALEV